jgi:hypothetical protein
MRGKQRCTWCGVPSPERRHVCGAASLTVLRTAHRTAGDWYAHGFTAPEDRVPHGTTGVGSVARSIVLTERGWAHVSPAVLRRLGR